MRVARAPLAVKGLALIFVLCVAIRLFSSIGASDSEQYLSSLMSSDRFASGILDFELSSSTETTNRQNIQSLIFSSVFPVVSDRQLRF